MKRTTRRRGISAAVYPPLTPEGARLAQLVDQLPPHERMEVEAKIAALLAKARKVN